MFDVGYSELLVIAIVLIVVVGPKDLPKMLRAFGKTMTRVRQMSGEFRRQFDDALKEVELDEVRKTIDAARSLDPRQQIRNAFNPLRSAVDDVKKDLAKPAPLAASSVAATASVASPVTAPVLAPVVVAKKAASVRKSKPEIAKAATATTPSAKTASKVAAKAPSTKRASTARKAEAE